MAAYTRQSSFSDGDTISASLFNNEYDALAVQYVGEEESGKNKVDK